MSKDVSTMTAREAASFLVARGVTPASVEAKLSSKARMDPQVLEAIKKVYGQEPAISKALANRQN